MTAREITPTVAGAHPTDVACPMCDAWVGWACESDDYGYHAAGYHPARHALADAAAAPKGAR